MATTTVRLDKDDESLLDLLAPEYGGRSSAIREALRKLAADRIRHDALEAFLVEWETEAGPADPAEVAAMASRYNL